ncbi:hypothetical protein GPECTOR_1g369 [Gonium pectorale]|uniref:Uncharacterized protein n=1 Tax=Gonium pectorale TaxID=33097 RepID=A0A150H309_GONPE|nr:hypothetical protein GPECTOR_1g369 [Gonium pectorale]|eukprot:KXZ56414.1 hypothetical protein GPECTOR_1g369 [Gonium pectorale]
MSDPGTNPSSAHGPSPGVTSGASAAGGGSKVDAIWQQLKGAHVAPKAQGVNFNKLWHGFSSDSMQGTKRPAPKPAAQQPSAERSSRPLGVEVAQSQPPAPAAPPSQQAATTAKPDPATALQLVARCVAGLKDSSQGARRKALQDVHSQLLDNPALSESWLADRLEGDGLGKALLRRFDDPADSCREMAVSGLLRLLQAAPQAVLSLLPYTFPVLAERVRHSEEGSKVWADGENLTEPCEEVRLALARLLRCLVVLGGKSFGGYAGEAVEVLGALCDDPFHEVQEEACATLVAMNEALGIRLQPIAKQLVAAVLPLTTAKRHRVRIAALQALRPTMHQGAHEMILEMVAWRDPNVISVKAFYGDDLKVNFCGKLAADSHPAVRREFLSVLADWMTGLRERLDHEARLLPFVLSALNDESPEIQADAVALLERLGVQYEKDHEKDLKDTLTYLPEEAHGIGWQAPGAAGFVYGSVTAGEETVNGGRAVFVLPGPLRSRPRIGTRRLVQSNFGRIVGALSEEITSWMLEARRRAAALLRTQLVLVEEWSEQHLHLLLPALAKAITDPEVRLHIRDCCAIVGAFTDPELALQLLQPRLADEAADVGTRAAALEVLACVARGAGPRRALDAHLATALDLLGLESLLTSEDTRVRRALQEAVEQLVETCGPACGRHAARLLWICLHLRSPGRAVVAAVVPGAVGAAGGPAGASAADPAGALAEESLMRRLAEVCGCEGGVDELVEAHRVELLGQVAPGSSPNVLLAAGVLARLLLPYSAQSYLLRLPDELLGRVLPPTEVSSSPLPPSPAPAPAAACGATAAAMDVDEAARPDASVSGGGDGDVAMEDRQVSGGGASPSGRAGRRSTLQWHASSTTAALTHIGEDLAWLPRQPRCATLVLLCLEACLETAVGGGDGEGGGEGEGRQLLSVLSGALAACQELPAAALLAALRCTHIALRRGLLPRSLLVGQLGELVGRLGACVAVVSGASCRLQACYVTQMLLRSGPVATALREASAGAAGEGDGDEAGGAALGALQGLCAAASSRLYDAADEVRCAALGLVREVVGATAPGRDGDGTGEEGHVARLVREVTQLRDVPPGSAFFDEHLYFVEGILDMASLAVFYYCKDNLGLGPSSTGLFQTAGQIPWELTPLLGLMTDLVPLLGYRRKAYLLLVGLVGSACWGCLAALPCSALPAALLLVGSSACTAWTQVIADAVLVGLSQGKPQEVASFYQVLSWATYSTGAVLSAYTTGRLLDAAGPRPVFALAAGGLLLDAACAGLLTEERRTGLGRPWAEGKARGRRGRGERRTVAVAAAAVEADWQQRWGGILLPALFIFCWQSCPSPTAAMFYFQVYTLHFSAAFQEIVYLAGSFAGVAGVLAYQALLVHYPLRSMLLWCALVGWALSATQLLLVTRTNLALGISDKVFVLGDYAVLRAIAEVMMTPLLALSARLCPPGVEATLFACLYSLLNLSGALSGTLGALLTRACGVSRDGAAPGALTLLVALCNCTMLLPLPLLFCMSGAPPTAASTVLAAPDGKGAAADEEAPPAGRGGSEAKLLEAEWGE